MISWLVEDSDWDWGYLTPETASSKLPSTALSKAFLSEKFRKTDKEPIDITELGNLLIEYIINSFMRHLHTPIKSYLFLFILLMFCSHNTFDSCSHIPDY